MSYLEILKMGHFELKAPKIGHFEKQGLTWKNRREKKIQYSSKTYGFRSWRVFLLQIQNSSHMIRAPVW